MVERKLHSEVLAGASNGAARPHGRHLHALLWGSLWIAVGIWGCSSGTIEDPIGTGPAANGGGHAGSGASDGDVAGTGAQAGSSGQHGSGDPTASPSFVAPASSLRKLTVTQYQNSVRDLLGSDIVVPTDLEADTAVNGFFSIGAAKSTVSPVAAEKLETAAYALATQAIAPDRRAKLASCAPKTAIDTACTTQLLTSLGRRAFRRPLTSAEVTRYVGVAEHAAMTLSDFWQGIEFAIAGVLQSPAFLFRAELGEPDPAAPAGSKQLRYDDYELASRLSYTLWNSTPDDALLTAADGGELTTPAGLQKQADRLLASDRVKGALDNFHSERLGLDELDALTKDPAVFSGMNDALRSSMRNDVLSTLAEYTFGDYDFREVFDTHVSFVDAALAGIYQVSAPKAANTRIELPADGPRAGLLGKAAYLATQAHDNETSPTKRGKYIREKLLCESIPPPPPNVVPVLPTPNPNAFTMRDRLKSHANSAACSSCHSQMDPLGLALEHFDTVGRYRSDDQGHALDVTGNLDGTKFDGAVELASVLRDDPRTSDCVARQLYRYAVAHVESEGEQPAIDALNHDLEQSNYRFTSLLRAITRSDGFRLAAAAP